MSKPLITAESETEGQMPGEHWGKRLRDIRESREIGLEAVAAELRLEIKLLQQLESEELQQLPSAPFVKGYLRNYARMLNVDATPILEAYSRVCGADAPGLTNVSRVRELTSKSVAPRSTTWIIVGGLVICVFIWWWSQIVSFKKTADEAAAPVAVSEPISEQQSAPAVMPEGGNGEAVVELALPEQPQPQLQSQPQQPAPAAAAPATKGVATAASKPNTITLKFSQDSWVDITDATGARLFMDMAKANESRTVTGVAPFKVMLGNAPAVTVEYNGAPYDHKAYDKQGIARFTLGAAE